MRRRCGQDSHASTSDSSRSIGGSSRSISGSSRSISGSSRSTDGSNRSISDSRRSTGDSNRSTDGSIKVPTVVLLDNGTSGAAELFASALLGNHRADLVGERTIGRVAVQKLVKLPDGSGLWISTTRYLTPGGAPLHEKGLEPTVAVESPDVEFGQPAPAGDPALDKAIEQVALKPAA